HVAPQVPVPPLMQHVSGYQVQGNQHKSVERRRNRPKEHNRKVCGDGRRQVQSNAQHFCSASSQCSSSLLTSFSSSAAISRSASSASTTSSSVAPISNRMAASSWTMLMAMAASAWAMEKAVRAIHSLFPMDRSGSPIRSARAYFLAIQPLSVLLAINAPPKPTASPALAESQEVAPEAAAFATVRGEETPHR